MSKPLNVIDRFEGKWSVIEYDGSIMFNMPKDILPKEAKEGDVINIKIKIDKLCTARHKKEINELAKQLIVE